MEGEGRVESGRWPLWKRPRATLNFLISIKRAPNPEGEGKGRRNCARARTIGLPPSLSKSGELVRARGKFINTPRTGQAEGLEGSRGQSNGAELVSNGAEASSDRDTSEVGVASVSICRGQTMREIQRTDAAEPRPFHVPLIDTLAPVRCGVATVMSSSLPSTTLSTPAGDPPINRPLPISRGFCSNCSQGVYTRYSLLDVYATCTVLYLPRREL